MLPDLLLNYSFNLFGFRCRLTPVGIGRGPLTEFNGIVCLTTMDALNTMFALYHAMFEVPNPPGFIEIGVTLAPGWNFGGGIDSGPLFSMAHPVSPGVTFRTTRWWKRKNPGNTIDYFVEFTNEGPVAALWTIQGGNVS